MKLVIKNSKYNSEGYSLKDLMLFTDGLFFKTEFRKPQIDILKCRLIAELIWKLEIAIINHNNNNKSSLLLQVSRIFIRNNVPNGQLDYLFVLRFFILSCLQKTGVKISNLFDRDDVGDHGHEAINNLTFDITSTMSNCKYKKKWINLDLKEQKIYEMLSIKKDDYGINLYFIALLSQFINLHFI